MSETIFYDKKILHKRIHINTTITLEMKEKAEQHNLKLSDALRVGIAVLCAEQGETQYIGELNVYRKLNRFQQLLEQAHAEINIMQKKKS